MENKNIGLTLIIGGIGLAITIVLITALGININPYGIILNLGVFVCICIGIYFLTGHPNPNAEWKKDTVLIKKRSKKFFIGGIIIVGISCFVIWLDSIFIRPHSMTFLATVAFAVIHFGGIILILYSIHLKGIRWVWFDFPITLAIYIVALIQIRNSLYPNDINNRIVWFLVFPLSFIPLLILYILLVKKNIDMG